MQPTEREHLRRPRGRLAPVLFVAGTTLVLAFAGACAQRTGNDLEVRGGRIFLTVESSLDTVFAAASLVLNQEQIDLRIFQPERGLLETSFIDLARYTRFDPEIWDATERLVKLRYHAERRDSKEGARTLLVCEPLYNPHEVITGETDYTLLRPVPPGHPGFDIASLLTRRIAAHAERRAVASP